MSEHRFRIALVVAALLVPLTVSAEEPAEITCDVIEAEWSLGVWGHDIGGTLCCLVPDAGRLRLDVAEGESGSACLHRTGRGWTVARAGGADMTLTPWGAEWEILPRDYAGALRILVGVCASGPAEAARAATDAGGIVAKERGRTGPARRATPDAERARELSVVFGGEEEGRTLRSELVGRGRGRGSARETLVFRWLPGGETRVRSSRRPGTLTWRQTGRRTFVVPVPETFLPLWPLSELVPALVENS